MFRFIPTNNKFNSISKYSIKPSQQPQQKPTQQQHQQSSNQNKNKKSLNIDFNKALNQLRNHCNKYNNQAPLPSDIIKIQKQILSCNENEIIDKDRLFASGFLNSIETLKNHPSKYNANVLKKILDLLSVEKYCETEKYITIISLQLGIAMKSWHFYPKLYSRVNIVINEISSLEKSLKFSKSDENLQEVLKNAYHVAYIIGMWKEMIWIRERLSEDSITDTMATTKGENDFGVDEPFKIITNQIGNSLFKSPIVDIQKEYEPLDNDDIAKFKFYMIKSKKYRNPTTVNVNKKESVYKKKEDEFQQLKNTYMNMRGKDGFMVAYDRDQDGPDEAFLLIVGFAVKLFLSGSSYCGIYCKDSNQIQLYEYSPKVSIFGKCEDYENQIDAKIEFTKQGVIVKGMQRLAHSIDKCSSYMDMELEFEFQQFDLSKY